MQSRIRFETGLFLTASPVGQGRLRWITLAITLLSSAVLGGCASGVDPATSGVAEGGANDTPRCTASENLLVDTGFTMDGDTVAWRMAQHTGELSFSMESAEGVLEIRRIATQPWMLLRQSVDDARLSGATIRYTADLKGDLPSEPRLHGFDHIGGLYLKIGRDSALLAEHEPNVDQWDWQTFSYEQQVPLGETSLQPVYPPVRWDALGTKSAR